MLSRTNEVPRGAKATPQERGSVMLMTIFLLLLIAWLLGVISSHTLGGFIHVLLILAIGVVLIRIIQGRRPVT